MEQARGPAFPFRVDARSGGIAWETGPDKIRDDLRVLIGTRLGERPMQRDFGTRVHSLVHEINDDVTADILRRQAHEAVVQWERRVVVTKARVERREAEIRLILQYIYSDRPLSGEMVVPLA